MMIAEGTSVGITPIPDHEDGPPIVWGLSAAQLHDACWRSRGVQCVRRGDSQPLARAELYALIEPGQLMLFDLARLTERLIWRNAAVTRLRLLDDDVSRYDERVEIDEHGLVRRIARRYGPRERSAWRVMLTRRRRIARQWMAASDAREAWQRIRQSVGWSEVDHLRWPGASFEEGRVNQASAFLDRLVAVWTDPAQAIEGIDEVADRVWAPAGEVLPDESFVNGPLWLGWGSAAATDLCLVGPTWVGDQPRAAASAPGPATVREIADIELVDAPPRSAGRAPVGRGYALAKRSLDLMVSSLLLLLLLPLLLVVALAIVIDDGRPVFYGHRRQAQGGRQFLCWKFRTMRRNSDRLTPELAEQNTCDGPQVFLKNDPRVTRVGHVLRRLHLDEVPQLWNVLVGEMSLVGPRPSPDDENQFCPARRDLRLSVPPGITGLWQVERTRAPGLDFQEWIKYDLEYVRRASFGFDLRLLARTAVLVFTGR